MPVLESHLLHGGQAAPGAQKTRSRLILDMPHHKASRHRKLEAGLSLHAMVTDAGDMVCYLVNQICYTSSSLMSHPVASRVRRGLPPHPAKLNHRDKTFKDSSQCGMEKRLRWTAAGRRTYNNSSPEDHYGPEDTGWGKRLSGARGKESLSVQGPQAAGSSGSPGWVEKIVEVGKLVEEVGSGSSACVQSKQLFFFRFILGPPHHHQKKNKEYFEWCDYHAGQRSGTFYASVPYSQTQAYKREADKKGGEICTRAQYEA